MRHTLLQIALAGVGHQLASHAPHSPEADFLARHAQAVAPAALAQSVTRALDKPATDDEPLASLARAWSLSALPVLTVALTAAVDRDAMIGRAIAYAQAPVGGSRPTLGLLAAAFGRLAQPTAGPAELALSPAVQAGLLLLLNDSAPLPERPVAVPLPISQAFARAESVWPGGLIGQDGTPITALPASLADAARAHADALDRPGAPLLVIRSPHLDEARAVATAIALHLRRRPFFSESAPAVGLGAWLFLRQLLPVFILDPGPGETKAVPVIPLLDGPRLVVAGLDGAIEAPGSDAVNWTLPLPAAHERAQLWQPILNNDDAARELATTHRHSASRIAQLGRLAQHAARLANLSFPTLETVRTVSRSGEGSGLESLAQPLPDLVHNNALVLPAETQNELSALVARCRHRDGLAVGLGPSSVARYNPGVRSLFVGPSGTGKTLAACWLATRLGLPLFRVDLASVTSKYIGETEKNLARLLARAERTECVLLFDEADSLFGKRTDVHDANDRFANAQTNYLLQRIESFDGIVILTSNSRSRFDSAFSRRLDLVLEFPIPGPAERRALWLAHLGTQHGLAPADLNLLSNQCDAAGGAIRNTVLAAAVAARESNQPIRLHHILRALVAEFRKSGATLPPSLAAILGPSPS
jgi:hypothetical protein